MSQAFEGAQPQVLRQKPKYKAPTEGSNGFYDDQDAENREALNIMHDKRVFRGNTHNMNLIQSNMTAQQKDELRIKEEQERKKIEMIKSQLLAYKRQKHKPSPYDLRPGPPARIDVDLTYFLTEQGRAKPVEVECKVQTDVFVPRPETPKYVPKKSGIDKITQIEDYDLFDYDREVQPILNVLLTKTIEQSLLEVEEETELEEIRKFKTDYQKRQVNLRDNWEEEVKREIQRIKHKNKALKNARAKREQQIKTMHKLQSLNLAKQFLSGCFKGTLSHLAQNNYWRDGFQDQLKISFKHFLTEKALSDTNQATVTENFINQSIADELLRLSDMKTQIKESIKTKAALKETTRVIESTSRRIVHFVFNPKQKCKVTPFVRKLNLMLINDLVEFEIEEHEKFDAYLDKFIEETLDDSEHNPVVYEENEYYDLELQGINHVSFAVANNPFFKVETEKYFPQALVINGDGEVLAKLGGDETGEHPFQGLLSRSNFRDDKIRVNDDRKIEMKLDEFTDPTIQIIFMVKTNDIRKETDLPENTYDQAWYRFQNEMTSQTLDYSKIKKVPLPEDYVETAEVEDEVDEDGNTKPRNELIYLAGRVYCEVNKKTQKSKWIYERWNQVVTSQKYPDICDTLASLQLSATEEVAGYEEQIVAAKQRLAEAAEERRQATIAAAQKKQKATKKGAKKEEEVTPTLVADEPKNSRDRQLNEDETIDVNWDLTKPNQFNSALRSKIQHRFTFGPIEFNDLNKSFDPEQARSMVIDALKASGSFESVSKICEQNGFRVCVKGATLKRGTSMLKHARFLQNLEVTPVWPSEPEPIVEVASGGEEAEEDQE